MAIKPPPFSKRTPQQPQQTRSSEPCGINTSLDRKTRQAAKIREIGEALISSGISTLDAQAAALALSRSTTWTIVKGSHKSSGLSATIINRMLAAPQLPPLVRFKILEYVEEKAAGLYGDCQPRLRKFVAHLSITAAGSACESHMAAKPRRVQK